MANFGQGIQGAAGGAMAGGSIGGPWGAAIGGGIGLAAGLFGGGGGPRYDETLRRRLLQLEQEYGQRAAPQGTAVNSENSQFRQNQSALIGQLEAMGRGAGPSAATTMMREANDRAVAGQASAAAGAAGRGANAGAAYLNSANQSAGLTAQSGRDAGLARVNEQLGALNQLGVTLYGARGADEATSKFNAGAANAMTQANMQAQLQQLGLNDAAQLRALQQAGGTMYANQPGLGTQILAGGASALGGMMTARGAGMGAPQPQPQAAPAAAPQSLPTSWNFNPTPGYTPYNPYGPGAYDPNSPVPSVTRGY